MKCLRCNTRMLMTQKKDIEIDYCPSCFGIWLDKGELQKIIELVGEYYSNRQNYEADFENYHYYDKDFYIRHPNRHKKSYLSTFFEFN